MEPEGSLPHSQVPATWPYPEPTRSSPCPTSHFMKIHLLLSSHLSIQGRGKCSRFATKSLFTVRSFQHLAQPPSWRTTPWRLSATACSIYSQLPSILEAVSPSATWRRAMSWWQGPTYRRCPNTKVITLKLFLHLCHSVYFNKELLPYPSLCIQDTSFQNK